MANKTNRNKRSPRARPPPIYSEQRHRAQQVCAEQRNIDAGKHGVHWWAQTRGRGFASVEEKRGREGGRTVKGRKGRNRWARMGWLLEKREFHEWTFIQKKPLMYIYTRSASKYATLKRLFYIYIYIRVRVCTTSTIIHGRFQASK